ncbi:PREDICTED: uncharacterized protein LOC104709466 [Camelina sativa]|uniref:Uncharacterized protein LOC104709466 n=1 Tax=Camelina sativa TaxID=90675 RepID=A0ABM0TCV1_CAMSA|nr:PREDICTED: uncharacterized protein LOC104709466 [Camelina sativa]
MTNPKDGGKVDRSVKKGRGPSMFALQGENYHLMGSLKPKLCDYPKFQQLYIVDTENEVANRMNIMSKDDENRSEKRKFKEEIVEKLQKMLNEINPYVQHFRYARDRFALEKEKANFHLRIVSTREKDGTKYNLPTASEVAALIPGDFNDEMNKRDIVIEMQSAIYQIEFQKRGLPHAHIIVWMDKKHKFQTADHIDKIICAEIPDKEKDPEIYEVVKECMIHGPCGSVNINSPCMVGGKCSKFYPKEFVNTTNLDRDGYPIYRRRDDGRFIEKNGFKCDNTYVVPYNRKLSLKYRAHINVEWCNQTGSFKYLFKYVHKGQDRVIVSVEAGEEEDETEYVSACEAFWRTNQYPIHYRTTPVVKLTFDKEGKQPIFYKDGDKPTTVLNRPTLDQTMFTAWFELCLRDEEAKKLTYEQIPNKYIYDKKEKEFRRRGKTGFSIGRINYVPHNLEDSYHLRILINSKTGPTSFSDIKTVKGVVYKTYKEACFALGLLDDDKEYIEGIKEANFWCSSKFCRRLFVIMLISESLTSPKTVWEETWKILSEDIERK